uniref:Homologous recombination OB-fold protein OB-fold domain-containing protein n=1 Tax=Tanacetum cinerariifolium TaxID=118510 RepID=A0A6L2JLS1_TANCI|nr:hypothetical protein [Tanacetum cinerariifolium]
MSPTHPFGGENAVKIILSPAGIIQAVKLRKTTYIRECGHECVMPTQEYVRKIIDANKDAHLLIKSCTPNALGELIVTLKDPSGTIHHKSLQKECYGESITVGAVLILHNVLVFSHKPSTYYLSITSRNLVKIFHKDMTLSL